MKIFTSWNWYSVKLIKQLIIEGEPDKRLVDEFYIDDDEQTFEEILMLVKARSYEHAYKIAENKAKKDEEFFPNMYGQQAAWKLIKAVDCFLILDKLKSGIELFSCYHTTKENMTAEEFLNKYFKEIN